MIFDVTWCSIFESVSLSFASNFAEAEAGTIFGLRCRILFPSKEQPSCYVSQTDVSVLRSTGWSPWVGRRGRGQGSAGGTPKLYENWNFLVILDSLYRLFSCILAQEATGTDFVRLYTSFSQKVSHSNLGANPM